VTLAQFTQMFEQLELQRYCLRFRKPAVDSSDPVMLPVDAPPEQHHYDPRLHGVRPLVVFPRPIYGQIDIFVALRDFEDWEWRQICANFD
jgi:hypothetical protein